MRTVCHPLVRHARSEWKSEQVLELIRLAQKERIQSGMKLEGYHMSGCRAVAGRISSVVLAACTWTSAAAAEYAVQVTGSRVNLRAKPTTSVETVGQVEYGDLLFAKSLGVDWVELVPPESTAIWVSRDYVNDGVVSADTLNLRSGPGVNYSVVGELQRGSGVEVGEEFGEWLRIAPPQEASVWISRQFIKDVTPLASGSATVVELPALPVTDVSIGNGDDQERVVHEEKTEIPPKVSAILRPVPSDMDLVPLQGQGEVVVVKGHLKKSGFGFRPPSRFRLLGKTNSSDTMICYVRGNDDQLRELLNNPMVIHGRQYWVQETKYPVVIPDKIVLPKEAAP